MKQKLIIFVLISTFFIPMLYVNAGTILSTYKYAWSSDVGYINFENVTVSDTTLSGFAWSENSGWIKFNPAQGGVFNDGAGNLSGSAWGEGLGWIDFENVSISTTTGRFSGTAVGDLVGTINFDCPNYCDVRTDWMATQDETPTAPTQISSGGRSSARIISGLPAHVESVNNPLVIFPQQSGVLNWVFDAGNVVLEVSENAVTNKTSFFIKEEFVNSDNSFLVSINNVLVNGFFYNISATDENGNPVRGFIKPIKITLPIDKSQGDLIRPKLYWLNETNWSWVLIPDAVFEKDRVTFYVNHLTKFAIFSDKSTSLIKTKVETNIDLPKEKKAEYDAIVEKEKSKTGDYVSVAKKYSDILLLLIFIILTILLVRIMRRYNR